MFLPLPQLVIIPSNDSASTCPAPETFHTHSQSPSTRPILALHRAVDATGTEERHFSTQPSHPTSRSSLVAVGLVNVKPGRGAAIARLGRPLDWPDKLRCRLSDVPPIGVGAIQVSCSTWTCANIVPRGWRQQEWMNKTKTTSLDRLPSRLDAFASSSSSSSAS